MTKEEIDIIRMKSDELRQSILRVCRVAGADSDFNIVAFNAYCDSLMALGAAAERNRTWTQDHWTEYERSIAAAAKAEEREACAKVCDQRATEDNWEGFYAAQCAEAIRARGETK